MGAPLNEEGFVSVRSGSRSESCFLVFGFPSIISFCLCSLDCATFPGGLGYLGCNTESVTGWGLGGWCDLESKNPRWRVG